MNTIVLLMFMFAIFGVVGYVVMIYNGLIALKNDIDKAWANFDVMLKQGQDKLPKLLVVVKGYMNYEPDTCWKITQPRTWYQQAVTMDPKEQPKQSMTTT